jgi:hypothetical protein
MGFLSHVRSLVHDELGGDTVGRLNTDQLVVDAAVVRSRDQEDLSCE